MLPRPHRACSAGYPPSGATFKVLARERRAQPLVAFGVHWPTSGLD